MKPLLLLTTIIVSGVCNADIAWASESSASKLQHTHRLAAAVAQLIKKSIPLEYEKRKDWGNTKEITVGLRNEGLKIHRRKSPVKHGTWKHYRVRLLEPEEQLVVKIDDVQPTTTGKLGFRISIQAKLDLWARAKIYRYGVHLIALEALGTASINLTLNCEIGIQMRTHDGAAGLAIDPQVVDAKLDIVNFQLRRVSNAHGPIIRELGEELPRFVEKELQGPRFISKLNRSIDKKRDRLELSLSDLLK